jgi:hypothetical protein
VRTLAEEVRLEPGERLAERATHGGRLRVADPVHDVLEPGQLEGWGEAIVVALGPPSDAASK